MDNVETIVSDINNKINRLVDDRNNMRASISHMQNEIAQLQANVSTKKNELEEMNQKYKVLKLAKSLEGEPVEGKKDLKLKINEMVREIDKCIALLNK